MHLRPKRFAVSGSLSFPIGPRGSLLRRARWLVGRSVEVAGTRLFRFESAGRDRRCVRLAKCASCADSYATAAQATIRQRLSGLVEPSRGTLQSPTHFPSLNRIIAQHVLLRENRVSGNGVLGPEERKAPPVNFDSGD